MSTNPRRCCRAAVLVVSLAAVSLGVGAAQPVEPPVAAVNPAAGPQTAAGPDRQASAAPYPRIAMLWSVADGIQDKWENIARHSVAVLGIDDLGMEWERNQYAAMAETIDPATVGAAVRNLDRIHRLNPGAVVLLEVYFFEETDRNYPPDSPWWLRDPRGNKKQFWPGDHMMDLSNTDYVCHIARRIEAVAKAAGGKAGIYLDNLRFETADKKAWVSLLEQVRKTCGKDLPILVNAGWDSDDLEWVCPYVNGIMYEDSVAHVRGGDTEGFYARIATFEKQCLAPHLSLNERFGPMDDSARMHKEFVRTLVYTDMAFLYSRSTNGHKHNWFDAWSDSLGRPLADAAKPERARLARRDFSDGVVLWLPDSATQPQTVALPAPMRDVLTRREVAGPLVLQPGTGAILHK